MADVRLVRIKFKDLVFLDGNDGRRKNPRKIEPHKLQKLAQQIEADPTFLIARPPLVSFSDGQYLVYAGHQRAAACGKILKWKELECSVENDVPPETMAKRAIQDNSHAGEWDVDLLLDFGFSTDELYDLNIPETIFDFGYDENEDGTGTPDNSKYGGQNEIVDKVNDANKEWVGMPEFETKDEPLKIIISFETEDDRALFADKNQIAFMKKETRTWSTWFPFKGQNDLLSLKYE